jgi:hypothetical protein
MKKSPFKNKSDFKENGDQVEYQKTIQQLEKELRELQMVTQNQSNRLDKFNNFLMININSPGGSGDNSGGQ